MNNWKKKKIIGCFFVLMILLLSFIGCGSNQKETAPKMEYQVGESIIKVSKPAFLYADDKKLLVADTGDNVIYEINDEKKWITSGTVGKKDVYGFSKGGYLDSENEKAKYHSPYGVTKFLEGYAVSDRENHVIRYVTKEGVVTLAGTGTAGLLDGIGKESQFHSPAGITTDKSGNLYVADSLNHCIRKIDKTGNVSLYAGGKKGYADGKRSTAKFDTPMGIYCDNERLYITDSQNQRIRMIDLKTEKVTTIAGNASYYEKSTLYAGGFLDGKVEQARFDTPTGIVVKNDCIYIADTGNSAIRKIEDGMVSTILQVEDESASVYPAKPIGLAIKENTLYISDSFAGLIYSIPNIQ